MMMRAVPPCETNSKGTPESGTKPSMAAIFKNDSVMTRIEIPIASIPPNGSGARVPTRKALAANRQ